MAATVRLFAHEGLVALPVSNYAGQNPMNTSFSLPQPYLAREVITLSSGQITSGAPLSENINAKILHVEVQSGKRVHYEVTPNGKELRVADTSSPTLFGDVDIQWGTGWFISLLEVT